MTDEVRVTSATGGQKGRKQAQLGALDPTALRTVAEVAGHGTEKYARYNFLRGYDWSLSYDALQRHLLAFWAGEDTDPESGLAHLGHAAWHCLALLAFSQRKIGTDDRPGAAPTAVDKVQAIIDGYHRGEMTFADAMVAVGYPSATGLGLDPHDRALGAQSLLVPKRRMPCCDFAAKQGEKVEREHAEAHEA